MSLTVLSLLTACSREPLLQGTPPGDGPPKLAETLSDESPRSLILSGLVEAKNPVAVSTPSINNPPVPIRFLVENGTSVKQGDVVAELDNSALVADLERLESALLQAEASWLTVRAQSTREVETARLELLRKEAAFDKAAIAASVPEDLKSAREYEQLQLEKQTNRLALESARAVLTTKERSANAALAAEQTKVQKAEAAWQRARDGVDRVVLRAPRDGAVQLGRNHREDRIFQEGDSTFPGWTLASIPDLADLRIRARLFDVDDGRLQTGTLVTVVIDAYPSKRLAGKVVHVGAVANQSGRRSTVRAFDVLVEFAGDAQTRQILAKMALLPGMSARIEASQDSHQKAQPQLPPSVSVDLTGELIAQHSTPIGPPVVEQQWDFKIVEMAPEGKRIEEGSVVLRFDPSPLAERLTRAIAARDSAAATLEKAEVDLEIARRQQLLALAEAEAKERKAKLKIDVPANLVARNELAAHKIDFEVAAQEVAYLKRGLEQLERRTKNELEARRDLANRARTEVTALEQSINSLAVRAPRPGTVLYKQNWRGEKKKVGDNVWRNETVLEIPDLTTLIAHAEVDEAEAARVKPGQKVKFQLDSMRDLSWKARVKRVSRSVVPKSWRDPTRVVRIELDLESVDTERMRPGMRLTGVLSLESEESTAVASGGGP